MGVHSIIIVCTQHSLTLKGVIGTQWVENGWHGCLMFQMHDILLKHSLKGRVKKGKEKQAFLFKGSLAFI